MPIVAIYSRKSKLTDKGESIENQIELCKNYAKQHFNVDEFLIYEDEGYSGGNAERPMFKKMLGDIHKKKFNVLICYRLDRISRNISDFSSLVNLLQDNDIDFVSIREQFDTSSPMGRAMMYIASVFAQLERETIAERIKDNMQQLARSGRWLGGKTPMGFESKPIQYKSKYKINKKMYILSPIEKELNIVIKIYDKYIELKSLTQLESWTLMNNIKTKTNKNFDISILKVILTNPVYAKADELLYKYFEDKGADIASPKEEFDGIHGLMVFNKHDETKNKVIKRDESHWIIAVGKHKGIIPSHEWIKVQELLEINRKKAPRTGTGKVGLITIFLRCGLCGSKMRVSIYRRKSGTYHYYKCLLKDKSKGLKCNVNNLNGKIADELVIKEISKISYEKGRIYGNLKKIRDELTSKSTNITTKSSELQSQIKKYEESIKNLTIQLSENKDSIASKYIIKQIEEYDAKIIHLKNEMDKIISNEDYEKDYRENIDFALALANDFSNNIDKLNFDEKKILLNKIIDNIVWDGEVLEINIQKRNLC